MVLLKLSLFVAIVMMQERSNFGLFRYYVFHNGKHEVRDGDVSSKNASRLAEQRSLLYTSEIVTIHHDRDE
ncbi:MAG: hypothetical protein A2103_05595 [Gammaproteobacteria bacterium GWF2_41_13]|nr:MAG: hypothetical protein A2103_05595 [Gammaproteobacteria bacterium GWF2_41_13]